MQDIYSNVFSDYKLNIDKNINMQHLKTKLEKAIAMKNLLDQNFYEIKFSNKKLDEMFNNYLMKSTKVLRIITSFFILLLRFLLNLSDEKLISNTLQSDLDNYLGMIAILICLAMNFLANKAKHIQILNLFFSFFMLMMNLKAIISPMLSLEFEKLYDIKQRNLYMLFIFCFIDTLYFYEYKLYHTIVILLSQVAMVFLDHYMRQEKFLDRFFDVLIPLPVAFSLTCVKYYHSTLVRESFLQRLNIKNCVDLSFDLIEHIKCLHGLNEAAKQISHVS